MTYNNKRVVAQINRLGCEAKVLKRKETETNDFGNAKESHEFDRKVLAFKTYPNRNTEAESTAGDLARDRPVFLIPKGKRQPEPPAHNDYLVYKDQKYEIKSHTEWDTHIEVFGEQVLD